MLFGGFRLTHPNYIPKTIQPPGIDPKTALVDPPGAVFHSVLMLITLGTLVGTSFVSGGKVQVWMVTVSVLLLDYVSR